MTQGIFVSGRRPKSKAELKKTALERSNTISIEATSMFGNEFSGPAMDLAEGQKIVFVGPDPYTKRSFYGTIEKKGGRLIVK
jgi:hypothetical protein